MLVPIDDRVKLVLSEGGFTYCNCIWIDDDIQAIIDSGADLPSMYQTHPEKMDMVVNTHHHYDHIRGNYLFQRARVCIHESDFISLKDEKAFEHYNSIDMWADLMPGYDYVEAALMIGIEELTVRNNLRADSSFKDGQVFDFGHVKAEVIHTPGHSAGHCAFWFPEQEFLFTGDICLTKAGPWYGELYADPDQMVSSIDRLIDLNPPRLISCHIPELCTDTVGRLREFQNRIFKREERIYRFLKQGPADLNTMAEKKLIYAMHPTPLVLFWEKLMLLKHLQRLEKMGLVSETEQGIYYTL